MLNTVSRTFGVAEIGVLADDLAGAMVAAARLSERGLRTVTVSAQHLPGAPNRETLPLSAQAVVVNLGTRDLPHNTGRAVYAERQAHEWAAELCSHGCRRFELRADSRLRGAHAAELRGLLAGSDRREAAVLAVLAYPDAGRRTRDGQQIGAVVDSDAAIDIESRLFPDERAWLIPLNWVHLGAETVLEAIRNGLSRGVWRFIADAETDSDLAVLAAAAERLEVETSVVSVSSSAWLRYHPAAFRSQRDFLLVAMTADSDLNRRQLKSLAPTRRLTAPQALAISIDDTDQKSLFRDHPTLLVVADHEQAARDGLQAADEVAQAILALLNLARRGGYSCRGVVISGGFTASRIAAELGSHELWPEAEITPLCCSAILCGGSWTGSRIVTASAAIGDDDALIRVVRCLWEMRSARLNGHQGSPLAAS